MTSQINTRKSLTLLATATIQGNLQLWMLSRNWIGFLMRMMRIRLTKCSNYKLVMLTESSLIWIISLIVTSIWRSVFLKGKMDYLGKLLVLVLSRMAKLLAHRVKPYFIYCLIWSTNLTAENMWKRANDEGYHEHT